MALRDGNRMPGATHDLAAILALSDVADQVVFCSPRTLAILANLAEVDVRIYSRYVKSYLAGGMVNVVDDDDTEATSVDTLANRFGIEVSDVTLYQQPWVSSARRAAATQTIPNNTFTPVNMDTLVDDLDSAFSLSTDSVIVPTGGHYLVSGRVAWAGSATGIRTLSVYLNGTEIASTQYGSGTTGVLVTEINHSQRFSAGDNIGLFCRQNTGGDLNLVLFLGGMNNSLSVYRLG